VTSMENRKCKLKGCDGMGRVYSTNQAYGMHEVSVVLETNGRFTQLTMSHLANPKSSMGTGRCKKGAQGSECMTGRRLVSPA
jgi:hypothetical protein